MNNIINNLSIFNAAMRYAEKKPVLYHMPGHKSGKGIHEEILKFLIKTDLTEIPQMDNLYSAGGILDKAMKNCAECFGTVKTFFLVNGSTGGIHTAIEAVTGKSNKIIMARDCHKSVYNKVIISGLTPYYIPVKFDRKQKIPDVPDPDDIAELMDKTKVKTVIVTSPNYYGMCCDIRKIADIVHERNGILIVDEAHGAHFKFSKALPLSAVDLGADIVIQSGHKTLPVINQGAYLHVCNFKIDIKKINLILSRLQTSSPSYIIMCLLEYAAIYLHNLGDVLYNKLSNSIKKSQKDLSEEKGLRLKVGTSENAVDKDITRMVIDAFGSGYKGFELEHLLWTEYNIRVEAADLFNVILIATPGDPDNFINILKDALTGFAEKIENPLKHDFNCLNYTPKMKMIPKQAEAEKTVTVRLDNAKNAICANLVVPYPPGIPLIVPGEIITGELLDYINLVIKAGGFVEGVKDNMYMDVIM